jgi:hypothetical protein
VLYDRWWNPAVEDQARDRAWRIGQTRTVVAHRLVCPGTVDERVEEVVAGKRRIADLVLPESSTVEDLDSEQLRRALGIDPDAVLTDEDEQPTGRVAHECATPHDGGSRSKQRAAGAAEGPGQTWRARSRRSASGARPRSCPAERPDVRITEEPAAVVRLARPAAAARATRPSPSTTSPPCTTAPSALAGALAAAGGLIKPEELARPAARTSRQLLRDAAPPPR